MKIQLQKKSDGAVYDITDVCDSLVWSGDYQQVARKFEFKILNPTNDPNVMPPYNYYPHLGDRVFLYMYSEEIFRGIVWDKTDDSSTQYTQISCYDDAIRLTKSEISKYYVNVTPEDIAAQVVSEFGISPGNFASTGLPGNYVAMGKSPYEVVMAGYTRASKQNGKKYLPRMYMGGLDIIEKGSYTSNYILDPKANLISSSRQQSLDGMVNNVIVYNSDDGTTLLTEGNDGWQGVYGLIQKAIAFEKDKDNTTIAKNTLHDMDRKAEVKAIGNDNYCITGNCVFVRDEATGLFGKFFIDGDSHEITQETDIMTLTLNFENIMDEKELDSELNKDGGSSSSSSGSSGAKPNLDGKSPITMSLSFYTGAADEGGNESASGKTLQYGMCASNVYPIGTKFYITGINGLSDGTFTVEDHGGSDFDSANRLDIYVGNDAGAKAKANGLGRQTVTAYKV